jgi:hypothetical protein
MLLGFASDTSIAYKQGLLLLNPTYDDGDRTNQFTKGVRSPSGISIGRWKSFILLLKQMHSF